MPRHARSASGGYVYHALNRAVARLPLLQKDGDYDAFERVLLEAMARHPTRDYVERNALRAGLVKRAEDWRWRSVTKAHRQNLELGIPLPRPWPAQEDAPSLAATPGVSGTRDAGDYGTGDFTLTYAPKRASVCRDRSAQRRGLGTPCESMAWKTASVERNRPW
jgi:hypothetical protein